MLNNYMRSHTRFMSLVFAIFSLAFVLLIQGAIPFVSMPTLGQAIWTTGFSQSLANQSVFDFYATNFGIPEPAAMAFGLAGAYPVSIFIRMGIHPADAYTLMVALWLSVAFFAAYQIARSFNLSTTLSSVVSILWLSMPVIWNHAGYSMLSLGIGLLSFYFWAALRLFQCDSNRSLIQIGGCYLLATIIAVFMDGYSFMMFAVGSSIFGAYVLICFPEYRRSLLTFGLPVHFLSFFCAYTLYTSYLGVQTFSVSPIDFFRGWGVDLMFLLAPSQGVHWIWDTLGFSLPRSGREQFGDASVWITTFAFPIIIVGLFAWLKVRKDIKLATGFLLLALFGFYMALGPSIKFNSIKPEAVTSAIMLQEYALTSTGNSWLSEFFPGFRNMRAAYRWSALGFFGFWLLIVLMLSREQKTRLKWPVIFSVILLIISNLPHIDKKIATDSNYRDDFFDIEKTLVRDLKHDLHVGEQVAFLPYRNDVFVNYLASRVNIQAYNIGGDKNLTEANKHWPKTMSQFKMASIDNSFALRIALVLTRGEADVIILPYIDLLWSAHTWPAPLKFKKEILPVISELQRSSFIEVDERKYYAIVRLSQKFKNSPQLKQLEQTLSHNYCMPPDCLQYRGDKNIGSQVGNHQGMGMQTDGRSGYLIYGPYQPMKSGEYILQLTGHVKSKGDTAVVDVVHHKAGKTYAKFVGLAKHKGLTGNILLEEQVTLDDVEQLEIRVRVDKDADLLIDGYSLRPINADKK
jgi:hypothetical protein